MQPAKPSGRSRSLLSIRNLLGVLIVVILAFATVHIVHGSGAKTAGRHRSHTRLHAVCTTGRHSRVSCHTGLKSARTHGNASAGKYAGRPVAFHPTVDQQYQMHVMHVLDRHRHTFDHVAYDTSIKTLSELTSTCADDLTRISIMTDEVDGIPHPGAWYSTVASFHRRVLQAYHDMASALEVCSTSAGNGDGATVGTSRQDLIYATRELHAVDDIAHHVWNWVHMKERRHH